MYLKSIEVQGFKSFANKITLDFHNGITGIVGPNGSGKSNISDAVRWVLGEQSAKQLRGSNMQDIIFSGTENRRPLSFAYVAITMDNSDHRLDLDYEEVTVARRVYRSGESEYLLNGSLCRLRDVHELFYDTGIGKEGYSIIGQGQIEKILNGRPEERRELFDEAAGIVKYKRRKAAAQKKLEAERGSLVRIRDILSELERQAGPLERQAQKARLFLSKRESLREMDANLFLLEMERMEEQLWETAESFSIADGQLKETTAAYEKMKCRQEEMEASIGALEQELEAAREDINQCTLKKGRLEGQIGVLNEKIRTSEMSDELFLGRTAEMEAEKQEKMRRQEDFLAQKAELDGQLLDAMARCGKAQAELLTLQEAVHSCNLGIEQSKQELLGLFEQKAGLQTDRQKYDTLIEQIQIRKAQASQRLIQQKSEESALEGELSRQQQAFDEIGAAIAALEDEERQLSGQRAGWEAKLKEAEQARFLDMESYHKAASRLESLKNIAERYDGYGGAVKKVMEKKKEEPGLLGVVSDLIKVEKRYETAIETALGGNIQNIVTADEETAKRMIAFLKKDRLGRATFLPLSAVKAKGAFAHPDALKEEGILGLACGLVQYDDGYSGIAKQLLGRVIVADTVDHAISLARKYRHMLSIVTLEGEFLRPGGSMTGGAFQNKGNLLGRNREIEELTRQAGQLKQAIERHGSRIEEIQTAHALISDDRREVREKLQQQYLLRNTAELNLSRTRQQKEQGESLRRELWNENQDLDRQIAEVEEKKQQALQEIEAIALREEEVQKANLACQEKLDEQIYLEGSVSQSFAQAQMEEAGIRQKSEFVMENIERTLAEIEKCETQMQEFAAERAAAKEDAKRLRAQIAQITQEIADCGTQAVRFEQELCGRQQKKQELSEQTKESAAQREEMAERIRVLDKEVFRLNSQREKLTEAKEQKAGYLWEEYELTPHAAAQLRTECAGMAELKKQIDSIKEEIRGLGSINVGAIEEYKELSKRLDFLTAQHDDLIAAEAALVSIIEELDEGMRKQFAEKFGLIRQEFHRAFRELFGGGQGTLELVEEEELLDCGIRIIAQPPGKKLQNMILLSGGEKALTAIALLFAIQNLKPSPFCLLDEIEAALDESNVVRFAKYLHRLSANTQFIMITHRRGSMAAADRLYGITMQEKGVSTLVSVDLAKHEMEKQKDERRKKGIF